MKKCKQLLISIKKYGVLVPIVVDKANNVIDGHRRISCAKACKIETIPCILIESDLNKEIAFETINTTAKKIADSDILYIYINGGSVSSRALFYIKQLEEIFDVKEIKNLASKNVTYRIIRYGMEMQRYIKKDGEEWLKKIIKWLADNRMIFYSRRAIELSIKKETIINAIANNRPLRLTYE